MASGFIPKYMDGNDSDWNDDTNISQKGYTDGTIYYRKIGKIVEVVGQVKASTKITGSSYVFGRLPEGFRPCTIPNVPSTAIRPTCSMGNPSYGVSIGFISLNGDIQFYKPPDVTEWLTTWNTYFSFIYLSD